MLYRRFIRYLRWAAGLTPTTKNARRESQANLHSQKDVLDFSKGHGLLFNFNAVLASPPLL